eukprot:2448852-Rhodomonas_salina.1
MREHRRRLQACSARDDDGMILKLRAKTWFPSCVFRHRTPRAGAVACATIAPGTAAHAVVSTAIGW